VLPFFCFNEARSATWGKIDISEGWVAQLAEQWTENPRVGGSIPPPARFFRQFNFMKDWTDGGEEWSEPWGNSAA
jgi:hypothetical protein